MGRKVMEQQGERVRKLEGVSTLRVVICRNTRATAVKGCKNAWLLQVAEGKRFGGSIMNNHGNKQEGLEWLGQKLKTGAGTQIGVPICFTEYPQLSSLAAEPWTPCCPLLVAKERSRWWRKGEGGKPLEPGCDTHKTPYSAQRTSKGERESFCLSKTACTHAGHALFGRKGGPKLQPQRWHDEKT